MSSSLIRKPVPAFEATALIDGEIKQLKTTDFKGKYWILLFYPLDFTFVCPTELIAFNERFEEFKSLGCEIVGASVDSVYAHLAWTNLPKKEGGIGKLLFPLVADVNKSIARTFGVLLDEEGIALRGLFLIDREGIVRHSTLNDLPIGRSVDEVLRTVKACQFTDVHGEVCPANWQPGNATITPNPSKSKNYFESQNSKQ